MLLLTITAIYFKKSVNDEWLHFKFEFRSKYVEMGFTHEHETLQTDSITLYNDDGMTAAE